MSPSGRVQKWDMYLGLLQSIRYVFLSSVKSDTYFFFPRATGEYNQILGLSWTLLSVVFRPIPVQTAVFSYLSQTGMAILAFPRWKWVGKAWRRKYLMSLFPFQGSGSANTCSECPATLDFKFTETALRQLKPRPLFPVKYLLFHFLSLVRVSFSHGLDEVCAAHSSATAPARVC